MRKTNFSLIILTALVVTLTIIQADDFIKKTQFNDDIEYLFNRNSIKDFKIFDKDIIALTYSGNILKFDLNTIKQTGELIDSIRFTCLGDTLDGKILLGRKDGAIFSFNPKDLSYNQIDKVNLEPYFLETLDNDIESKKQILCVTYCPVTNYHWDYDLEKSVYSGGLTYFTNLTTKNIDSIEINNNYEGHRPQPPSNLIKTSGNLVYFSSDFGEFGGFNGYYNPKNRDINSLGNHSGGYNGFVTTSSNKVYSYGGLNHMGISNCKIYEINESVNISKYFYCNDYDLQIKHNKLDSSNKHISDVIKNEITDTLKNFPRSSINIILENKYKNKLIVFAGNYVYETDSNFTSWKIIYDLKLQNSDGRSYSFGYTTAISAAVILDSNQILCSTESDGFLLLDNKNSKLCEIPNNKPIYNYKKIFFYRDKYFFSHSSVLINNKKECYYINPYPKSNNYKLNWYDNTDYVIIKDTLYDFTYLFGSLRAEYFNKVDEDTVINIYKSHEDCNSKRIFQTSDENIWYINVNNLFYFDSLRWSEKGTIKGWEELEHRGFRYNSINQKMPWIIKDDNGKIMILNYDKDMTNLSFEARYLIDKDTLIILDGCTINNANVLLTQNGLYSYDVVTNLLKKLKLELPDSTIELICCDEKGRIWLGGEGLYLVDDIDSSDKSKIHKISSIGNEAIATLVADKITKGIIFAIYNRGIFFVK